MPSVTWALGIARFFCEVAHDAQHLVLGQALHGMGALAAQRAVQRAVLRGGALDARGAEAVLTLERDGVAHQLEADGALQLIRHRRVGEGEGLHGNVGQRVRAGPELAARRQFFVGRECTAGFGGIDR